MRREEFMTELAALLQDISAEERIEAMQYYNDYLDEAGEDQEACIIEQLGSPGKVAAEVKAGLRGQSDEAAEYRETGYTDTRFEYRESPARREDKTSESNYNYAGDTTYTSATKEVPKKPWTNRPLKIVLIVLVVLAAIPILGPIIVGLVSAAFGIVLAIAAILAALVISSVVVGIAGFAVAIAGVAAWFTSLASGLLVTGVGLILTVLGVVATVASIKLCTVVFRGSIRGIVFIGRKIFPKEKAVA